MRKLNDMLPVDDERNDASDELPSQEAEWPSVLDWVKSILHRQPIPIPSMADLRSFEEEPVFDGLFQDQTPDSISDLSVKIEKGEEQRIWSQERLLGWLRIMGALLLAFLAQHGLEGHPESKILYVILYLMAGGLIAWAAWDGEFSLALPKEKNVPDVAESEVRLLFLGYALIFSSLTFFFARDNRFTPLNVLFWGLALASVVYAFWEGNLPGKGLPLRVRRFLRFPGLHLYLDRWKLLVLLVFVIALVVRFAQVDTLPNDGWSDHAEKLFDVVDVLDGQYSIFFMRNTGREPLQFYFSALIAGFLGTGASMLTLKLGTILAGVLTLPYIYLFAKELAGREVGLAAMFLAGIAYWPNVISRMGLRFPLYPLFAAPALYYLLRGLRTRQRNDFILLGFAVGMGLLGYSPARVIPVVILVGAVIYVLHAHNKADRIRGLTWLLMAGVVALVVFMPLFGAVSDNLSYFFNRMISRMGTTEAPYPGSPVLIFFDNLWDSLTMFAWDNGGPWVSAILNRPALDWVTGGLYHLGLVILVVRYIRQRTWQDLFLLVSIPLLMLPSIMSLAFPMENPALNRSSGAIIPVFTIAALAIVAIFRWLRSGEGFAFEGYFELILIGVFLIMLLESAVGFFLVSAAVVVMLALFFFKPQMRVVWTRLAGIGLVLAIGLLALGNNFRLVFYTFADQLQGSLWNTREIGDVVQGFATSVGSYETSHVVAFPHWIDTRLVAVEAGEPGKEYGVDQNALEQFAGEERTQLFVLHPNDTVAQETLSSFFPRGVFDLRHSDDPGHDFMLFIVPEESSSEDNPGNAE